MAAARSLVAGRPDAPSFTPIPYFWSDQYGIRFQVLGNPSGTDEAVLVEGSFDEGKFVVLYGRAAAERTGRSPDEVASVLAERRGIELGEL